MNHYDLLGERIDSIELKCLVVSRGVKVAKEVYRRFAKTNRLGINPLMCNCMIFSDGVIAQLTDMGFHLSYLTGILSWDNLKLLKYARELETRFSLKIVDGKPALFYDDAFLDFVTFAPKTDFYAQKTSSGLPFMGNAVLQGLDWVAFQCLWPCEFAASGKPCQFCFSGAEHEALARRKKGLPKPVGAADAAEIVRYAVEEVGCSSVQLTGGSTFNSAQESGYITSYLKAIDQMIGRDNIKGEILLYITPPDDLAVIDEYVALGASRIACSLELWDEALAAAVTPGKIAIRTRKKYLDALEYTVNRFGAGKAFSNFIIGIEPFESLREGAIYLAERGIMPTASIWMPMGRPVMNSMQPPGIDYYRRVKELFAELYQKYDLEPPKTGGLNVCMERDIWNYSVGRIG